MSCPAGSIRGGVNHIGTCKIGHFRTDQYPDPIEGSHGPAGQETGRAQIRAPVVAVIGCRVELTIFTKTSPDTVLVIKAGNGATGPIPNLLPIQAVHGAPQKPMRATLSGSDDLVCRNVSYTGPTVS